MARGGNSPARQRVLDRLRADLAVWIRPKIDAGVPWSALARMTGKAEDDLREAFEVEGATFARAAPCLPPRRPEVTAARLLALARLREDLAFFVLPKIEAGVAWSALARMTGKAEDDLRDAFEVGRGLVG